MLGMVEIGANLAGLIRYVVFIVSIVLMTYFITKD